MLAFYEQMFSGAGGAFVLPITASVANPNLHALALAAGWNGVAAVEVDITAPLINTIDIPAGWSFPQGLTLKISSGTRVGGVKNGGFAIRTYQAIKIDNRGTISGGGGRGGLGQYVTGYYGGQSYGPAKGGSPGDGQGFDSPSSLAISPAGYGQPGSVVYFSGEVIGGGTRPYVVGGSGGSGGSWGAAGQSGGYGSGGAGSWGPEQGFDAGSYIIGNSRVTWVNPGTRLGRVEP